MSEKVPVFDPESKDLRRLPLRKLKEKEFDRVEVPKWRRRFDVYESNEPEKDSEHTVVTKSTDDIEGKRLLARLYISRLGIASDVQRLLFSKHRWLYIGAMPDI